MANKFARSNGNFDGPIWALTSSGVAGSTTTPTIGDNAIANTFTVQITGSVACDNITNGVIYGGTVGGLFNLQNLSQVTSNVIGQNLSQPTLILSGTNSSSVFGNLTPGGGQSGGHCISFTSNGTLTFVGNSVGSPTFAGCHGIVNSGSGSVIFTGDSVGGTAGASIGIVNNSTGSVTVYGNLSASASIALQNISTGPVTVYGNLNGSKASALSNTSTGSVTVVGNVIGDTLGGSGIESSNAAANVKISGNLIGAPNGIPAVYAPSFIFTPIIANGYIQYAKDGTGISDDSYLYQFTPDSFTTFSSPPVSSVRTGILYSGISVGTCNMPQPSAVAYGTVYDSNNSKFGLAINRDNVIFNTLLNNLSVINSVGDRVKKSSTTEATGHLIASFSN